MEGWRYGPLIFTAIITLSLVGCGGGSSVPSPGPGEQQLAGQWTGTAGSSAATDPGFIGVPEIPFDSIQTSKLASTQTGTLQLWGSEYLQKYNAEVDGTSLVMQAPVEGAPGTFAIAYGMYRFAGLTGKEPQWLNIECLPHMFGQQCYVGLADYTEGDWRWFGPVTFPEFELDLRDLFHHIVTQLGNLYFIVVCEAGNGATLSRSTLTFAEQGGDEGRLPGAPHDLMATDGEFDDRVVVEWEPGIGADYYELWRKVDCEGSEWREYAEAESARYVDEGVDPGVIYLYKALSVNAYGESSHSNVDSGYAGEPGIEPGVRPPVGLQATDGEFENKVAVWWSHEGDYDYFDIWRRLYCEGDKHGECEDWQRTGEAEGFEYLDWEVDPGVVYEYKARAILGGHESEYSNVDTGYAANEGL